MGNEPRWINRCIGTKNMISVLIVCKQVDDNLIRTIKSVEPLKPQILVDISESDEPLGIRKNRLIRAAANDWVLILDTDETVSVELRKDLIGYRELNDVNIHGFSIDYQNYIFGIPVYFGGEQYSRNQFFNKSYGEFTPSLIHEHPIIKGNVGHLKGVIHHYSYVSLSQVLKKFTKYAWQMAGEKRKVHEGVTLKKLFMYGPHMVWARAVKDQGWRDGWRGIVIALCFGYMETLMYWLLLWRNLINR